MPKIIGKSSPSRQGRMRCDKAPKVPIERSETCVTKSILSSSRGQNPRHRRRLSDVGRRRRTLIAVGIAGIAAAAAITFYERGGSGPIPLADRPRICLAETSTDLTTTSARAAWADLMREQRQGTVAAYRLLIPIADGTAGQSALPPAMLPHRRPVDTALVAHLFASSVRHHHRCILFVVASGPLTPAVARLAPTQPSLRFAVIGSTNAGARNVLPLPAAPPEALVHQLDVLVRRSLDAASSSASVRPSPS